MNKTVAVVGAGYVGMQVAVIFAKSGFEVIAYDIDKCRIDELNHGIDKYLELNQCVGLNITFTYEIDLLAIAKNYIVALPTPVNPHLVPDLSALEQAATTLGRIIKKDDVIVFESTVFPGATEELMIPILARESGLKSGCEFYVGYSPERVIPGNVEHGLAKDAKIISAENEPALKRVRELYEQGGFTNLYPVPTMKIAEASKLLENIQRDVNIALMNEYASVMSAMGIPIHDVLTAAKTKWNFLPFKPGLVGGHCIPVDPYYLIYQANKYGVSTNLISSSRQVNEQFIHFIADTLIKLLTNQGIPISRAKVVLAGISFKPNVSDTRHSLSIELCKLLETYDIEVVALDPIANRHDLNLNWVEWEDMPVCDAMILIQEHDFFIKQGLGNLTKKLVKNAVFMDIPGVFANHNDDSFVYWGL